MMLYRLYRSQILGYTEIVIKIGLDSSGEYKKKNLKLTLSYPL